jgi:hypothetical protein
MAYCYFQGRSKRPKGFEAHLHQGEATMSTIHTIGARLCAAFFVLLFCSTVFADSKKVEVCHIPPSNPDNYHTITINEKTLASHLAHFDLEGACNEVCATLCDDGDACTIDDAGDCEQNGCSVEAAPVDCDDADLCTVDSCDPESGCLSTFKCEEGVSCNPTVGVCEPVNTCPCFNLNELQDEGAGAITECGENFDSSPVTAGAIYTGGTHIACSGSNCATTSVLTCAYTYNGTSQEVTTTEDADCRTLILENCGNPN